MYKTGWRGLGWAALIFLVAMPMSLDAEMTEPISLTPEFPEAPLRHADIWSLGISGGFRLFSGDVATFKNKLYPSPATVLQDMSEEGDGVLQLGIRYGLDELVFPGITVGLKLDYSFVAIRDLDLEIRRGTQLAFQYKGGFLSAHTIGILPLVELRFFSLLEATLTTSLPPWWYMAFPGFEIYLYGGPRTNVHAYEKSDLTVTGLEAFTLGWEIGGGVELALSSRWSLRAEYGIYQDVTEFEIEQNGLNVMSGELDMSASRVSIWLVYYF
jgi:hypothetical protein